MNVDDLRCWLKANLRLDVSVERRDDGCPEEGLPATRVVRVTLLLRRGDEHEEIDSAETTLE